MFTVHTCANYVALGSRSCRSDLIRIFTSLTQEIPPWNTQYPQACNFSCLISHNELHNCIVAGINVSLPSLVLLGTPFLPGKSVVALVRDKLDSRRTFHWGCWKRSERNKKLALSDSTRCLPLQRILTKYSSALEAASWFVTQFQKTNFPEMRFCFCLVKSQNLRTAWDSC